MRQEPPIFYLWMVMSLMVVTGHAVSFFSGRALGQEQVKTGARKVIAKVNGKPIYEDQLKLEVENSLGTYRKYGMKKVGNTLAI